MKKTLVLSLMIMFTVQLGAGAYEWKNVFNYMLNSASQKATQTTPSTSTYTAIDALKALSDLQTQAKQIDTSVQNNFLSLVYQLSTQQESSELQKKVNKILSDTTKTQDEISEEMAEIMMSYAKELNDDKEDVIKTLKDMSETEQAKVIETLANLMQEGQDYLELAKQGINTTSTAVKTAKKFNEAMQIVSSIKSTATEMQTTAKSVISVAKQIQSLVKAAGLM